MQGVCDMVVDFGLYIFCLSNEACSAHLVAGVVSNLHLI